MAFNNSSNVNASGSTFWDIGRDQIINNIHLNSFGTKQCCSSLAEAQRFDPLDLRTLLDPVPDASYSRSGRVARCMKDTRQPVIAEIMQWVNGASDRPICWLNGPAGSGKSAIAQTVAELCSRHNRLGASFFFLRGTGRRSDFTRFLPTLAYQLASVLPSAEAHIRNVLQSDLFIGHRSLAYQFQKLMIDSAPNLALPFIIVIDALDECNDKESITHIIQVLLTHAYRGHHVPFRFLLTSRVEEHIRSELEVSVGQPHPTTYSLALQNFPAGADIRTFFRSRFSDIYRQKCRLMPDVRPPWPSKEVLEQLVRNSSGSFIFASTLVDFVNDGTDLPHLKLQMALGTHTGLDPLYAQVLSAAERGRHFERVIGTVMLLTKPLSINELGGLLQVETGHVLHALLGIQSVLIVPERNDQPYQLVHTSLRDFLNTPSRSREWYIHSPACHLHIAIDCLKAIAVKPEDDAFHIGFREYACLHWCHHLDSCLDEGGEDNVANAWATLVGCLVSFTSGFLNFWIDTAILANRMSEIVTTLNSVLSRLEVSPLFLCFILKEFDQFTATAKLSARFVTNCHWSPSTCKGLMLP
jgi:hypothetical protein